MLRVLRICVYGLGFLDVWGLKLRALYRSEVRRLAGPPSS